MNDHLLEVDQAKIREIVLHGNLNFLMINSENFEELSVVEKSAESLEWLCSSCIIPSQLKPKQVTSFNQTLNNSHQKVN